MSLGSVRGMSAKDSKEGATLMEHIIWSPNYSVSNPWDGYDQPTGTANMTSFAFTSNSVTAAPTGGRYVMVTTQHMKRFLTDVSANVFDLVTANDFATRVVKILAGKYNVGGAVGGGGGQKSGNSPIRFAALEAEIAELRRELALRDVQLRAAVSVDRIKPVHAKAKSMQMAYTSAKEGVKQALAAMKLKLTTELAAFGESITREIQAAHIQKERAEKGGAAAKEIQKALEDLQTGVHNICKEVDGRLRPITGGGVAPHESGETADWGPVNALAKTYGENKGPAAVLVNSVGTLLTSLARDAGTMENIQTKFKNLTGEIDAFKAASTSSGATVVEMSKNYNAEKQKVAELEEITATQKIKIKELTEFSHRARKEGADAAAKEAAIEAKKQKTLAEEAAAAAAAKLAAAKLAATPVSPLKPPEAAEKPVPPAKGEKGKKSPPPALAPGKKPGAKASGKPPTPPPTLKVTKDSEEAPGPWSAPERQSSISPTTSALSPPTISVTTNRKKCSLLPPSHKSMQTEVPLPVITYAPDDLVKCLEKLRQGLKIGFPVPTEYVEAVKLFKEVHAQFYPPPAQLQPPRAMTPLQAMAQQQRQVSTPDGFQQRAGFLQRANDLTSKLNHLSSLKSADLAALLGGPRGARPREVGQMAAGTGLNPFVNMATLPAGPLWPKVNHPAVTQGTFGRATSKARVVTHKEIPLENLFQTKSVSRT